MTLQDRAESLRDIHETQKQRTPLGSTLGIQREAIAAGHVWGASPPPEYPLDVTPLNLLAIDPAAKVVITVQIHGPEAAPGAPPAPPHTLTLPALRHAQRITICRHQGNIWAYREMPGPEKTVE